MPGDMDGLALAHYVRERWPSTMIIICSGNEKPGPDMMPRKCSFLPKPFQMATLSDLLAPDSWMTTSRNEQRNSAGAYALLWPSVQIWAIARFTLSD